MLSDTLSKYPISSAGIAVTTAAAVAVGIACQRNPKLADTLVGLISTVGNETGLYKRPIPSHATDPCSRGMRNCIRTAWIPPKGTSQEQAVQVLKTSLEKYPKPSDIKIDQGGWQVVDDQWSEKGSAHVEFKSGIGPYAKKMNFGKPFIDDVLFQVVVEDDDKKDVKCVEVRSSSRKGFDDLGVNKKRLKYLISSLPQDWQAPDPTYKYK